MKQERPLSPFMIGPYYRPQLTSVLSFSHRITGMLLAITGIPLFLYWLLGIAGGQQAYQQTVTILGKWPLQVLLWVNLFCLFYHLLNGVRHLFWDAGAWLELKAAYLSGWGVVILSVLLTALVFGVTR